MRCFGDVVNTDYVNQLRYNSSVHKATAKRPKLAKNPELIVEQTNVLIENPSESETKDNTDKNNSGPKNMIPL